MAVGCELWKHRCSSGILESSLQRTTTVPPAPARRFLTPLPHAASSRRFLTPLPHAASSRRSLTPVPMDISSIPDDRITIQKRDDGTLLVRIQSAGEERNRLPDAVFSFRCGDPQYAYWLSRLQQQP
jgi:hypothetical protein